MTTTEDVFNAVKSSLLSNKKVILYMIKETEGETPRKKGAVMIVSDDKTIVGTIGGGKEEKELIDNALALMAFRADVLPSVWTQIVNLNGVCGGKMVIDAYFYYQNWSSKIEADLIGLLNTYSSSSYKNRVFIFGGGHVGKALVPVLKSLGFEVNVYDDRKEYASFVMHPNATNVICAPYNDILKRIKLEKNDYVVVMTYGHDEDVKVLEQILPLKPFYIGCMGSRKKSALTKDYLIRHGIDEKIVGMLHSPIGLDIKAETPEEIAISIAAEIIQYTRCRV